MIHISSVSNKLVKELQSLKKASFRKKRREFFVDGAREISLALRYGWIIKAAYYCDVFDEIKNPLLKDLLKLGGESRVYSVSEAVFKKIAYKENPDGFFAIFEEKPLTLIEKDNKIYSQILVLEETEKPGNLGAVLRTAAAAGVDAIILNDNKVDIYNPNVIRASEGEVFSQNIFIASFGETVSWLKKRDFKMIAVTKEAVQGYTDADLSPPLALVFGSESSGLSKKWQEAVNYGISIPMRGELDSLNLSVSVAVVVFESLRQKKQQHKSKEV